MGSEMCIRDRDIDGDLSGCIRILVYLNKDLTDVNHVYLDDAKQLRPDR